MTADLNNLLKNAVEAHSSGRVQDAEKLYKAILDLQPSHAATNFNIGLLYANAGRHAAALPYLRKSTHLAPENAQSWHLYIRSLLALDETDEAASALRKAHSRGLKGDLFLKIDESIRIKQVSLLLKRGAPHEAYRRAKAALAAFPRSAPLHNLLGSVFASLSEWNKAIDAFQNAISIDPQFYRAFNNLGIAQREKGNAALAINSFMNCISIRPSYPDAYKNMGETYCTLGLFYEAFLVYKNAIENNVADDDVYRAISFTLSNFSFPQSTPGAAEIICHLLDDRNSATPESVAVAAVSLLKCDPFIRNALSSGTDPEENQVLECLVRMSNMPLLLSLMSACPVPDLEFETLFTRLRCWVLLHIQHLRQRMDIVRFQQCLALQCYITEYIYAETAGETEAAASLEKALEEQVLANASPEPAAIACLASYRPLHEYDWSRRLAPSAELAALYSQQIVENGRMRELRAAIPVLRQIEDRTSLQVQTQYEENPYPRWSTTSVPKEPFTLAEMADFLKLRIAPRDTHKVVSPEILVAGCGTGKQAINLASSLRNAHVVALDLSRQSLGYAKLKAVDYGLDNIVFYQGDISDVGLLNRKFDIVQCGGVLHHMADPLSGWRSLLDALKPGGLMNVALYSALARKDITRIRTEAAASRASPSREELSNVRTKIIAEKDRYPEYLLQSSEFYNRSMFRDLFLHVQEVCFTIGEIGAALRDLDLTFCGFVLDEGVLGKFRAANPSPDALYDLDRWQAFETDNPDTFREMYQFWCQKAAT